MDALLSADRPPALSEIFLVLYFFQPGVCVMRFWSQTNERSSIASTLIYVAFQICGSTLCISVSMTDFEMPWIETRTLGKRIYLVSVLATLEMGSIIQGLDIDSDILFKSL